MIGPKLFFTALMFLVVFFVLTVTTFGMGDKYRYIADIFAYVTAGSFWMGLAAAVMWIWGV